VRSLVIIAALAMACTPDPTGDSQVHESPTETEAPGDTDAGDSEHSAPPVDTQDTGDTVEPDPFPLLPAVPLHTQGRWIMDAEGERFKLASVNWYGFEELDYVPAGLEIADLDAIAAIIAELGFNSVRLPFSLELVQDNPTIEALPVAANPELAGITALELMDAVIDALAGAGLVVILDNHSSEAVWYSDTNGLWYTDEYPEAMWLSSWALLADRYAEHPAVVGYDLRNELRNGATWGGPPETDWKAAAGRAADTIFAIDDSKLIVVEGVDYSATFAGAYHDPLELSVPGRLVYSPHDYQWFHGVIESEQQLAAELGSTWGFLIVEDQPWTAPVWVGEFGTCSIAAECVEPHGVQGWWFSALIAYLNAGDIDFAYWPVNGTMARAEDREYGAVDWYGILDETWLQPSLPELLDALQGIQEPWAFPDDG